jgi:hypothetical protein
MLQTTININIDFYDKKYILINAKQLDKQSRFLSITCYNHGEFYRLNEGEHSAYIRYRKADNNSVFNFCEIDRKGSIVVELTEQMLAVDGICVADLVIVNEGGAKVDPQTGEIVGIENTSILSTMPLHIDVTGTAVVNSDIESSYEYNGLNAALEKAEAEYTEVIRTSKSYAIGNAGGIRDGEDTDNAKYYYEQSLKNANNAKTSETNAKTSATNAKTSEENAATSEANSKISEDNALQSEQNAKTSEDNAKISEDKAKVSELNTSTSETNAKASATNALKSEVNAKASETNSATSEANALNSADRAQSYAVGGTGTRGNEDYDNAHYYYELTKNIVIGLDSGFIPMGTVSFSELANVEKATGYVYNIRDDFVTTDDFREGAGKSYTAGVNVYFCADGLWDAFGGVSASAATVDEVKDYLGI